MILFNAWTFDDILVVIEVTDLSSRRKKAELYASEEVKDYWVLNIPERCIEVFREPRNGRCRINRCEEVHSLAVPETGLSVSRPFERKE